MTPVSEWQIDLIHWLQGFQSPVMDAVFIAITSLGEEGFFLVAIPIIWFVLDGLLAAQLSLGLLISFYFNALFKGLFAQPRPHQVSQVLNLAPFSSGGYGIPSGHAQSTIVFWGYLAYQVGKPWLTRLAVALIFLVALSRLYLGAHFVTDIVAGWVLGAILMADLIFFGYSIEALFRWLPKGRSAALAAVIPFVLFVLYVSSPTAAAMGAAAGLGMGLVLNRGDAPAARGPIQERVLRAAGALIGLFILYFGLKQLLPDATGSAFDPFLRFVRYLLVGLWVSFGAPLLFRKLEKPRPAM